MEVEVETKTADVDEEEEEEDRKRRKTKKKKEEEGQNIFFKNNVCTLTRSSPVTFWYISPTYIPCSDPSRIA